MQCNTIAGCAITTRWSTLHRSWWTPYPTLCWGIRYFRDRLIFKLCIKKKTDFWRMEKGEDKNISLSVYPLPTRNVEAEFDAGQFTSAMFIGMLFVLAPSALACEIVLDREVLLLSLQYISMIWMWSCSIQIHARNLLRVNGLTFGLYFGSFFIVLGSMMVATCLM